MNKDLFLKVYKNKVLNILINNQIRYIHKKINKHAKKLSWNDLTPELLSLYGYIDQFKKLDRSSYNVLQCGMKAARNGHLHILKYIYKENKPDKELKLYFYCSALESGIISIIEYTYNYLDSSYHDTSSYLEHSAIGGVDACEWVANHHKNEKNLCERYKFYGNAILSGNLDTMKWGINFSLGNMESYWYGERCWNRTFKSKNISLLEFMFNHEKFKIEFDLRQFLFFASECGNFDVMDWIFSKSDDPLSLDDEKLYSNLLSIGRIRVIKYFSRKFGGNNNNIAEWFFKKCEQYGFNAIDRAIVIKKLKILIWMYEQTNFQGTLNPLGNNPSLEIIKWFTENNRPERISTKTLRSVSRDNISIVEYIIRNRTEQFPNIPEVKRLILLKSNTFELLDMLPTSDISLCKYDFNSIISSNRINSIKWIHNNTTIGFDGIESAYFLNDSTMIEWLHQNRSESCDSEYIKSNFNSLSTSVHSFIIHNKPEMIPSNVLELVSDDLSLSKFIIDTYQNQFINQDSLFDVSQSGNVEIVKYLHEYYKKHSINRGTNHFNNIVFDKTWKFAIKNKFNEIFKYLYENHSIIKKLSGIKSTHNPILIACKYGSLEICKYLHENTPFKLSIDHIDQASINGHLHLVRWIYENHQIKCSNKGLFDTAFNEHYNIVRYLLDNKHNLTSDMFKNAIINVDLKLINIYENHQCKPLDFNIIDIASEHGQFEIVEYFFSKGHRGTNNAIDSASENGHLDIIKFLRNNGHKCTSKSIKSAYYNEHKYVVKWLLENIEFPTSEMPTIDHYYNNDSKEIVLEYIKKQKLKENENKKRDSESIPPLTNKKTKFK